MTTTTPSAGSNKFSDANTAAKAKASGEARTKKKKKKSTNNNNLVKYPGLIKDRILKGGTLSLVHQYRWQQTIDIHQVNNWLCGIKRLQTLARNHQNLEAINDGVWKTPCTNKKRYASKYVTRIKCEGEANILEQRWVITDC